MTAFIGMCLENSAFLAADTRRTNVDTGKIQSGIIKKIYQLNGHLTIATGGLGTIGHKAREIVMAQISSKEITFNELTLIIKDVFSEEYAKSLQEYPGHTVPLNAIVSGKRIEDGVGFICGYNSMEKFEPYLIEGKGHCYFAGSNTPLVQNFASSVLAELQNNHTTFQLDKWAIKTFNKIVMKDNNVSYPIQYIKAGDSYIEQFPVTNENFRVNKEFEIEL